jgi:hypothetical protein
MAALPCVDAGNTSGLARPSASRSSARRWLGGDFALVWGRVGAGRGHHAPSAARQVVQCAAGGPSRRIQGCVGEVEDRSHGRWRCGRELACASAGLHACRGLRLHDAAARGQQVRVPRSRALAGIALADQLAICLIASREFAARGRRASAPYVSAMHPVPCREDSLQLPREIGHVARTLAHALAQERRLLVCRSPATNTRPPRQARKPRGAWKPV